MAINFNKAEFILSATVPAQFAVSYTHLTLPTTSIV